MDLALLLVGSSSPVGTMGDASPCAFSRGLAELAKGFGFGEHLHLPGRVAPDALGAWYRRSDIVVVPRKPYAISELVSPIKVLGAAAQGKALLVSDVAPLQEFVQAGVAVSFAKGDVDDLAKQIASLLQDPGKRQAMSERARRWIKEERNFGKTVQPMLDAFAGPSRKAEWDCVRHKFFQN